MPSVAAVRNKNFNNPIAYLIDDEFIDTLAAGAVNGTVCAVGTGTLSQRTRVVADTNLKLSIGGGVLTIAAGGVGSGNPGLWYGAFTRTFGRTMIFEATYSASQSHAGWDTDQTSGIQLGPGHVGNFRPPGVGADIAPLTTGVSYRVIVIQRITGTNGGYIFIKGGAMTKTTFLGAWGSSGATLYPGFTIINNTGAYTSSYLRVPEELFTWFAPLVYDTFTRSNGALGNSETTGPDSQTLVAKAWTDQEGTWAVSTNAAAASALASGSAIATVNGGKADVHLEVNMTRSVGNVGAVCRYVDTNNKVLIYHDGTNLKIDKVIAGTTTNVASTAIAFSAGATLRVFVEGSTFRALYNGNAAGGAVTISDSVVASSTLHGLFTTDTGNTLDVFQLFARGSGGEYDRMDAY
jgi:hypothetical protein